MFRMLAIAFVFSLTLSEVQAKRGMSLSLGYAISPMIYATDQESKGSWTGGRLDTRPDDAKEKTGKSLFLAFDYNFSNQAALFYGVSAFASSGARVLSDPKPIGKDALAPVGVMGKAGTHFGKFGVFLAVGMGNLFYKVKSSYRDFGGGTTRSVREAKSKAGLAYQLDLEYRFGSLWGVVAGYREMRGKIKQPANITVGGAPGTSEYTAKLKARHSFVSVKYYF